MIYKYDKNLVATAKTLRKNMTPEEKRLWYVFLKRLPITVNRQKNIGNYIVDFFIASQRIVIELDGLQHQMCENWQADKIRDAELRQLGITVLRYSNRDINDDFQAVCADILRHLGLRFLDLRKDENKE